MISTASLGLLRVIAVLAWSALAVASASAQAVVSSTEIADSPLIRSVVAESRFALDQSSDAKPSEEQKRLADRSPSPILMAALHSATVTAHILDVHSTIRALDSGAAEGNPLMFGVSKNRAALIAVKSTLAAGVVYATHRIAKRNKAAAIVGAVAVNSLLLTAAHHNYSIARMESR